MHEELEIGLSEYAMIKRCASEGVGLWFNAMAIDGARAWVFSNECNALLELSLETFETQYLGSVPGEGFLEKTLYLRIIKHKEKLILVPARAKALALYDLTSGEFEKVPLIDEEDIYYGAELANDKVFMLCINRYRICVFDIQTGTMHYIKGLEKSKAYKSFVDGSLTFGNGICLAKNKVLCVGKDTNEIYMIAPDTEILTVFEAERLDTGFSSICFDGEDFWLTEIEKLRMIRWNEEKGVREIVDNPMVLGTKYITERVIALDDIYVFPAVGNYDADSYRYRKETHTWEIIESISEYGKYIDPQKNYWPQIYTAVWCDGQRSYLVASKTDEILTLDPEMNLVAHKKVYMHHGFEKIKYSFAPVSGSLTENSVDALRLLFEYLQER